MGYPQGHKELTRQRIVEAARKLWKSEGYKGAGIDRVMKEAGLTRGGFYAHFKSKDDLLDEVLCENMVRDGLAHFEAQGIVELRDQKEAVIDWYLGEGHRDHPEEGCLLTTLTQEATRLDQKPRKRLTSLVTRFARWLKGEDEKSKGYAALSLMVGAVTLSRMVDDETVSERILQEARVEVKNLLSKS
ncbi:TetR/AcrR family transcriptional regulator [Terasakiella pusilla]|uniref:TetR/AcrR family transcriptional regulator n=1 Tax=Terasakiella pusilla TaxID=64973 RepID=UPI003AA8AE1B